MKKTWTSLQKPVRRLVLAFILSNLFSVALFFGRVAAAESTRYWFLLWNLFLGILPLVFAIMLAVRLRQRRWSEWSNVVLGLLWLGFLPNSFYLLSDLIHLKNTGEVSLLYDAVLFCSFIFNAYVAGFLSVYLVHIALQLRKDTRRYAHLVIGLVFLACGFAIYLGRYMRWNSWDVLVNPFGLLFDVSDNLINPLAHPQVIVTTLTFFGLLSTSYALLYQLVRVIQASSRPSK